MDYLKSLPENLPEDAPLWIFAFDGAPPQAALILLKERLTTWAAHGAPVHGSFELVANTFLFIVADTSAGAAPSGCSIDWLLKAIDGWCHDNTVRRHSVGTLFYTSKDGTIKGFPREEIDSLRNSREITDDTIVYDLALSTLKEARSRFALPYKSSWYTKL